MFNTVLQSEIEQTKNQRTISMVINDTERKDRILHSEELQLLRIIQVELFCLRMGHGYTVQRLMGTKSCH